MTFQHASESISRAAARELRGGMLPHVAPPATPVSTHVRLELEAAPDANPLVVLVDYHREDTWTAALEPAGPGLWSVDILTPQEPTLLFYHFVLAGGAQIREKRQLNGQERVMYRDPRRPPKAGADAGVFEGSPRRPEVLIEKPLYGQWQEQDFRIAVYLPEGAPPDWVQGQVAYQIFPDRFARSGETPRRTQTYGRPVLNLPWGAEPEKPPKSRDFFGGNLRGVIDHLDYLAGLGVTMLYFTPIFDSPTNHRYDAIDYHRIDPQLGSEQDLRDLIAAARERGIRVLLDAVFNHCSSDSIYFRAAQADQRSPYFRWFHFNHWPNDYLGWAGVRNMPEFVECPEVEEFFFGETPGRPGVAQHWLAYGTAGWRTDVTPWLSDAYWRRFHRAVRKAYPEAYLIAEDWGDASRRLLGDTFDATMNYRFANAVLGFAGGKLNALELDDRLETLRRDTPPAALHAQLNLLDSHDTPRALTVLGGDRRRLMLAVALQFAYPGVPMVYSGDEAGQQGTFAEDSRRAFPWDAPDQQLGDFYQRAIHARRDSPALSTGAVETAWIDPRGGYAILRHCEGERIAAVFNNSAGPLRVEIPLELKESGRTPDLLGALPEAEMHNSTLIVDLPPFSAGWYRV